VEVRQKRQTPKRRDEDVGNHVDVGGSREPDKHGA
jgi:hypothetical protein